MTIKRASQPNRELYRDILPVSKNTTQGVEELHGPQGDWYAPIHVIQVYFRNKMKPEFWMS